MRIICALIAILIILISLNSEPILAHRTKKVSKNTLKQIKALINSKIEKELPQSDSLDLPPLFVRNPKAKPYHDELSVNDADEFFQGDVELSDKQAKLILARLTSSHSSKKRTKRKVGKVTENLCLILIIRIFIGTLV